MRFRWCSIREKISQDMRMTKEEWARCTDPEQMLEALSAGRQKKSWLSGLASLLRLNPRHSTQCSQRKLWLFGVACCRNIWHLLPDERYRHAVEVAARLADGAASAAEQADALAALEEEEEYPSQAEFAAYFLVRGSFSLDDEFAESGSVEVKGEQWASAIAQHASAAASEAVRESYLQQPPPAAVRLHDSISQHEQIRQARLLREIVGYPFAPPCTFDAAWLSCNSGAVSKLSQMIYDERTLDRMPVLADALEDAGCADQDILAHCRSSGEHVRGCWVVDLILGKG
jgi:hypothetical protein